MLKNKSPPFLKPEDSAPGSEELSTGPYTELHIN